MSPMLDIQRRHASVFRIRLGDQGVTDSGKSFPRKLTNAIRVTAANERVCQAFVDVYGGEVQPWKAEGRNEFEAYLPTTSLAILVLPGQSLQQWWESYKKSVCVTRCDGERDTKTKKPCHCPADIEQRMTEKSPDGKRRLWCAPMTRVDVLCPDVAVIGSGALVTHSLIAAETLPQSIAVAEAALSRGLMVPARLRVTEHKGLTHYVVPQIEIVGISLVELMGEGAAELSTVTDLPALPSSVPSWRPVGELPAAPVMSVADQVAEVAEPKPKPARANAAEPLRPTGLAPRTAAQAADDAPPLITSAKAKTQLVRACEGDKDAAADAWGDRGSSPISPDELARLIDGIPVVAEVVEAVESDAPRVADTEPVPGDVDAFPPAEGAGNRGPAPSAVKPTKAQNGRLFALLAEAEIDDEMRHDWAALHLQRPVESFTELTRADVATLIDQLTGGNP